MLSAGLCVPKQTENLLRLSPLFRDYFGEQQARFTERLDSFCKAAACYVPRFYHTPDAASQLAGIPANGYKSYLLSLPPGSFILGFLHTTSSQVGSAGPAATPVANIPPNASGFTCQITDVSIDHKWFGKPAEEAWFINDNLLGPTQLGFPPYPDNTLGFTFPSFPRLLPVPYPVIDPGQFIVEFWNQLLIPGALGPSPGPNTDCQMTFLVLVPDGVNQNAMKGSGK